MPACRLSDATIGELFAGFGAHQQKEFGYAFPRSMMNLEIVSARVSAEADSAIAIEAIYPNPPIAIPAPTGYRDVYFEEGGWQKSAIFDRTTLPVGFKIHGPAVIEQNDTTTLVLPRSTAIVDERLNLICKVVDDAA